MNQATQDAVRIIDRWVELRRRRNRVPAIAIGVVEDGEVAVCRGYGMATERTRFRLASITKTFTAIAVMQLVEEHLVSLDDPISRHLDWVRSDSDPRVEAITVRQLLSHTSGLAREGQLRFPHDGYWPTEEVARNAIATSVVAPANSKMLYSNYGFYLLGHLIAHVTHQPCHEYVCDHIVVPLGMGDTSCEPDPAAFDGLVTGYLAENASGSRDEAMLGSLNAFGPAVGGVVSTAADMCKYMRFWIDGNSDVLPDQTRSEMLRAHWSEPDDSVRWGFGMELSTVGGREVAGHGGLLLGFRQRFGMDLERRRGVVVLANASDAPTAAVCNAILKCLERAVSGSFGKGAIDRERAQRFCGEFITPFTSFVVSCLGEGLISMDLDCDEIIDNPDILEIVNDFELAVRDGTWRGNVGQTVLYEFDAGDKPQNIHYGSYPAAPTKQA